MLPRTYVGLIEQQKFVMIRDQSTSAQNEPLKRLTEQKHYCNETCSPLVPSRKKRKKKGGVSLTSQRTIASNKYKHYPRRREERRKKKKRDLASIHIPLATIFFRAAGISSIPATKPLPPGWREGGRRPPAALWIRRKCPILWQGADKILRFPKRIEASLFTPVP